MEHKTRSIISAKKVTGARVETRAGEDLGRIEDLMVDKIGGRVAYAVLSFGGLLGIGAKHFALPWEALHYDAAHEAYRVGIEPELLRRAPGFDPANPPDMSDQRWGAQIHEFYGYRPYWARRDTDLDLDRDDRGTGTMGILL